MTTIESICARWSDCRLCRLAPYRSNVVVGRGPAKARLMLIGEGPGSVEDEEGKPFVGPAGQLLDELAAEASVPLAECYITNIVACRPPKNRTPAPDEAAACRPRIDALIWTVEPRALLLLGRTAQREMRRGAIHLPAGIEASHGRWFEVAWSWKGQPKAVPAMTTWHPAALLHQPDPDHRASLVADLAEAWRFAVRTC